MVDQGRPASPAGPSHDSVRAAVIARLEVLCGPHTVDLIATVATVQYPLYHETGPLGASVGYDALVQSWDEENAWAIPPVARLNDVAARIEEAPVDLPLLVPRCPQAPWHGVFLRRSWEYMEIPEFTASTTTPDACYVDGAPMVVFRFMREHRQG